MRFKKLSSKIWNDKKFLSLSLLERHILIFLITHPNLTPIGILITTPAVLCAEMELPEISEKDVKSSLEKLKILNFIDTDEENRLILIKDFYKENVPANPNVCTLWRKTFEEMPDCKLIFDYLRTVYNFFEQILKNEKFCEKFSQLMVSKFSEEFSEWFERYVERYEESEEKKDEITLEILSPLSKDHLASKYAETIPESEIEKIKNELISKVQQKNSIEEIFDFWKITFNTPKSKLDKKRLTFIEKALKSYSVDQIKSAIIGCSKTPHNMGENDRGEKYIGLNVILRDSDQIDRFIRNAENPPAPAKNTKNFDYAQNALKSGAIALKNMGYTKDSNGNLVKVNDLNEYVDDPEHQLPQRPENEEQEIEQNLLSY